MSDVLPEESKSQEIGHWAVQAFWAQKPVNWRPQDLSGDSDAGLDALVQVVVKHRVCEAFHAQFKGSTNAAYSADRTFISVRMRIATLNYYKRIGFPVMLVFADFSSGDKPGLCPIYYLWIHEKLDEVLAEVPTTATKDSTVTFHVPTANRLHDELDVVPYLAGQREARQRFETLKQAISGVPQAPPTAAAMAQLAQNITSRGATYLESTLSVGDTPWADPTPGTLAWSLKQLHERLLDGMIEEARALLERLDLTQLRDAPEKAELEYLRGVLARLSGETAATLVHFAQAHQLAPSNPRYWSAWAEERLVRSLPAHDTAESLLLELTQSPLAADPKLRTLKVRLLTILERFEEAKVELDQLPPRLAAIEHLVWLLSQHRLDEVAAAATSAQALDVSRQTLLTMRILAAQARFQTVFGLRPGEQTPAVGPPGLDARQLLSLWEELRRLAVDLSQAGWPLNSEFIMDSLTAVSVATGKPDEGLAFVDSFLHARSFRVELQSQRLKLAVLAGQFEIALRATEHLPHEGERIVHRVLIHYQAGDLRRAVSLIPQLLALEFGECELLPEALAAAAHSAHQTFNSEGEQQCVVRLEAGGFSDRLVILKWVSTPRSDQEARNAARQALLEAYRQNPASTALQDHLVGAMRAGESDEAAILIEVMGAIRKRRQLRPEEVLAQAEALSTLGRTSLAIHTLEEARRRFPDDAQLTASEALMVERAGDIPRARSLLGSLLDSPQTSELARSIYINIAARSGQLDAAAAQLESLLAAAKTTEKRKDLLRSLYSVEVYRDAKSPRLWALAQAFGQLANPESEEDEGMFLQMTLIAGILTTIAPSDSESGEVQRRVLAYTTRFPDSPYFGAIPLPTEGGAEAFQKALKKRLGPSLEDNADLQALRRQLSRGQIAVPFAWRPRTLVPQARTVPQLWELTKRIGRGNPQLTFDMDQQTRPLKDLRRERRVPLIDLLSLLVITDLQVWPALLRLFDRIAISKETLRRIQQDDGPLGAPTDTLVRLRERIRTHLDRIEQPGTDEDSTPGDHSAQLHEAKALAAAGHYLFYSDDVASRVFVLGEKEHELGLNTGQLIRNAEQLRDVSTAEVAHKIAQLARWNVGFLTFEDRHLLECLPKEASLERELVRKISALHQNVGYQALVSGIWDPPKPYVDTAAHIRRLLVFVLRYNPDIDPDVLAAIWASWLDKVILRPEVHLAIEQHLAAVLVLSCDDLKDHPTGPRSLWNAYRALIARRHGERMDEAIEKDAIQAIGRTIASVSESEELRNRVDDLMAATRRGLTEGTADYQYVMDGFQEERRRQIDRLGQAR